jgi:quinol monooxygenase YgiN
MAATRREILGASAASLLLQGCVRDMTRTDTGADLFGLIGQMKAQPGQRAALIAILKEGTGQMPGNLAYMINEDRDDPDSIWIVEIWKDAASHSASLSLPAVRAAIAKGRPLIAGFGANAKVRPVAGMP